ncbi:MAG: transporter substrate-binding domain-containing protein [Bacillaceae bacterium]
MKKLVAVGMAAVMTVGLLGACGTDKSASGKEEKKVLTMGTSADYAPFEYIDTKNGDEIIGFDIDLANAIGDKLGYEIKVKDMEFASLLTAMNAGKVDFVMSSMTPNPDRLKNADFTDIYYEAVNLVMTTEKSGIKTVEDLKGKVVGVQTGSIQEDKAEELNEATPFKKIESRDRIPEMVQELKAGRFDAIIIEDTVAKGYLEKMKEMNSFAIKAGESEGSAVALPKDSELTKKMNDVIKEMKENGELEKLIIKWFN